MTSIKLNYPVRTLDNQLLLPAETVLSPKAMDTLISTSKEKPRERIPLSQCGSVLQDMVGIMIQGPYQTIFSDRKKNISLLDLMEKINLIEPILNSLNYFKKHDYYTYCHILIVFALSTLLAQDLVEDHQDLIREAMAGPSHDFGKVGVPLSILKKTDPLSRTERGILEHHTAAGFVLLSFYLQDAQGFAAKIARDHHERRDGSGYPVGVPAADPIVEIIATCDIFDALISPRPYRRRPYDTRTALEELTEMALQGRIGWGVLQALVAHNRTRKLRRHEECVVSRERRGTPPEGNLYGVFVDDFPLGWREPAILS